jgi:hypothetical protein
MAKNRKVFKNKTEESKKEDLTLLNVLREMLEMQRRTFERMLEYEQAFEALNQIMKLNEKIINKQNEVIRVIGEEIKELKQTINKGGKNG